MRSRSPRLPRTWRSALVLATLGLGLGFSVGGCGSGKLGADDDDTSSTSTSVGETDTGTDTGDEPPLSNGPGGASTMTLGCAPDDGAALVLTIGLGSACDAGAPDPSLPFVRLTTYDEALLNDPIGATSTWTDWQLGQAQYAPDGSEGAVEAVSAGTLHIDSWDPLGEVGSTVTGWYTLTLDDASEIGAGFTATYCGGEPMCG